MSKSYQWFIARGRVSLQRESSHVVLELHPEGSPYCVLSPQDALEIAAIIADEARAIWEASATSPHDPARVEGDVHQSCRLWTRPGVLEIVAHDAKPFLALAFDSNAQCKLNVTDAIALVQILQYMSRAIEERAPDESSN